MASLRLVLAWVCDPAFGHTYLPSRDEDARCWDALGPCLEKIAQLREQLGQDTRSSIRFTWLVRADGHIASLHNDPAWCLRQFRQTWSDLQAQGDSLGWVFYPAVPGERGWVQVYDDEVRLGELLREAFNAYKEAWGVPDALLMGWCGHRHATVKQAAELGIAVDLSAIPGWYTTRPKGYPPVVGACDWEITPNAPYYPSAVDYRRPVVYPNEPALDILELPWSLGLATWRPFQQALVDLLRPGSLGLRRNYRRRRQGIPIRARCGLPEFRRLVTPLLEAGLNREMSLTILCPITDVAFSRAESPSGILGANLLWLARECGSRGVSFEGLPARETRKILTPRDFARPLAHEQQNMNESAHQH